MELLDLIRRRRSCRKYVSKPVPRESLERCLEAARLAPSACNSQPWRFIVVEDPATKDELCRKAFSGLYRMNAFAAGAGALVVVVRENSKFVARVGGHVRGLEYSLIDIGIACEHLVLQAEEEGLGTCWLGWFNERAVKKLLGIPRGKRADLIISVGYPETEDLPEKPRKALSDICEFR